MERDLKESSLSSWSDIDSMFPGVSFLSLLTDDFTPSSSTPPPLPLPLPQYPDPILPLFSSMAYPPPPQSPFSFFHNTDLDIHPNPQHLDAQTTLNLEPTSNFSQPPLHLPDLLSLDPRSSSSSSSSSKLTRTRRRVQARQRLSERTRRLQKLLPWDHKMSIPTTLEHAHKYIKFLRAQLRALLSMPSHSSSVHRHALFLSGTASGALASLTRNQLLQVLVNSPLAQTLLSSQGCCVFSVEQFHFLTNLASHSNPYLFSSSSSAAASNFQTHCNPDY